VPDPSRSWSTIVLLSSVLAAGLVAPAQATPQASPLARVSTDPYTDAQSQHSTEVGPDTFAHGDTIVAAFQAGRRHESVGMGASNLGVVVSTDRGRTWTETFLPGTTPTRRWPTTPGTTCGWCRCSRWTARRARRC
jgi:hypothetical protein